MSLYDQQLGFKNPILEAYLSGVELRRRRQRDQFQQELQTEKEKREEKQRQDAVKHWEDQIKFQRERLAFDREKETADSKYRVLQGKKLELDMKDLGFKMLAEGRMQGSIIPKSWDEVKPGLDELYNTSVGSRPGTQALLAGAGLSESALAEPPSTSVVPYTKGDVEVAPGITLKGNEWATPYEYGQSELARKAPLKSLEEQIALRKLQQQEKARLEITNLLEKGRGERLGITEAGKGERLDTTLQARKEAADVAEDRRFKRDERQFEFKKQLETLKASLKKDATSGKGTPSTANKLALLKSMKEGYENVYKLGEKSGWKGQHWSNALPWSEAVRAALDTDDDDVKDYKAALGRLMSKEFHDLYGSVISTGEAQRSTTFLAETWNSPDVARRRLKQGMAAIDLQIKNLSSMKDSGSTGAKKLEAPKSDEETLFRALTGK